MNLINKKSECDIGNLIWQYDTLEFSNTKKSKCILVHILCKIEYIRLWIFIMHTQQDIERHQTQILNMWVMMSAQIHLHACNMTLYHYLYFNLPVDVHPSSQDKTKTHPISWTTRKKMCHFHSSHLLTKFGDEQHNNKKMTNNRYWISGIKEQRAKERKGWSYKPQNSPGWKQQDVPNTVKGKCNPKHVYIWL